MRWVTFSSLGLLLAACAAPPPDPGATRTVRGWERFDLWVRDAVVASAPTDHGTWRFEDARIERPLAGHRARIGPLKLRPGTVRTLALPPGTALTWRLPLGEEGFLTYRPLSLASKHCQPDYRLSVTPDGHVENAIHDRRPAPARQPFAAAETVVDLGALAGHTITVRLEAVADEGCPAPKDRLLWGSPAVYSRRARVHRVADADRPNVLLLSFDALRADALGAWGRTPSATPALDRLATEGTVYSRAFATANATNPSFASIMTGLYVKNHGVYDLDTPLPEEHRTLAESLTAGGYDTRAIVSARHLGGDQSGLRQGFATYTMPSRLWAAERSVDAAIDWLTQARTRPFFLWLHLFDPHTPHTPPTPFAEGRRPRETTGIAPPQAWEALRRIHTPTFRNRRLGAHELLYDAEVAYLDRQTDRVLDLLDSHGRLEQTIVVVLSDHGENLWHSRPPYRRLAFRHSGLRDATTHVPMLVRWPGGRGAREEGLVQTIDLFPTLLGALGLPVPENDGRDLRTAEPRRFVFAENQGGGGWMIRNDSHLYQRLEGASLMPAGRYLYDLARDRQQVHNLVERLPDLADRAERLLRRWRADVREDRTTPAPRPLSDEEQKALEALGYLSG